jgi:alpha-methylacyl-CoA racemase
MSFAPEDALTSKGMLDGVRILDLSRLLPGPACSWFLSEMGAEVTCVEPLKGTSARQLPPYTRAGHAGALEGSYFTALHGGKRSLAIDFRHPETSTLILGLVASYDVLIEGFKPGVLEQMGLSPDRLHNENPDLVIARISGYGQSGPWAQRPGHDLNYLSVAGALAGVSHDDEGHAIYALQISDLSGAMVAAMGICAALFERARSSTQEATQRGRVLDISLCESALALSAPLFFGLQNGSPKREPHPRGEVLNGGIPSYRTYRCADGRWLSLGALEPKFLNRVQSILGADPATWADVFLTAPLSSWVETLSDACSAPVLSYAELIEHPQHQSRGSIQRDETDLCWIRAPFSSTPLQPPPRLGEHTWEILESTFSSERIAHFKEAGLLGADLNLD